MFKDQSVWKQDKNWRIFFAATVVVFCYRSIAFDNLMVNQIKTDQHWPNESAFYILILFDQHWIFIFHPKKKKYFFSKSIFNIHKFRLLCFFLSSIFRYFTVFQSILICEFEGKFLSTSFRVFFHQKKKNFLSWKFGTFW